MLHAFHEPKDWTREIHEIEHKGDRITAEIFSLLNRTFITPFEREDIIALGSIIDNVLDAVDDVAVMLRLYRIKQPTVYLLESSDLLVRAVDALAVAIDRLESMQNIAPL